MDTITFYILSRVVEQTQPGDKDSEIPENPSMFIIILQFLKQLAGYVLLYFVLTSLGKWLHIEAVAYFIYFSVVFYKFINN